MGLLPFPAFAIHLPMLAAEEQKNAASCNSFRPKKALPDKNCLAMPIYKLLMFPLKDCSSLSFSVSFCMNRIPACPSNMSGKRFIRFVVYFSENRLYLVMSITAFPSASKAMSRAEGSVRMVAVITCSPSLMNTSMLNRSRITCR